MNSWSYCLLAKGLQNQGMCSKAKAPDVGVVAEVAALYLVAKVVQDFGDAAHADAANAGKVQKAGFKRDGCFHIPCFAGFTAGVQGGKTTTRAKTQTRMGVVFALVFRLYGWPIVGVYPNRGSGDFSLNQISRIRR